MLCFPAISLDWVQRRPDVLLNSIIACLTTRCESLLPFLLESARAARKRRRIRSCGGIPGGLSQT